MTRAIQQGDTLADLVDEFFAPSCEDPVEGATLWAFHTRGVDRALEPDEVTDLVARGQGVLVVELVWDEDDELVQRGAPRTVKSRAELRALRTERLVPMTAPIASQSSTSAPASKRPVGDGAAKSGAPWHGATLAARIPKTRR